MKITRRIGKGSFLGDKECPPSLIYLRGKRLTPIAYLLFRLGWEMSFSIISLNKRTFLMIDSKEEID